MIDLHLTIITLARTGLALLISYLMWLIVQAHLLSGSTENEEDYA